MPPKTAPPPAAIVPKSNSGPFGIPPGGPWFVYPLTGTIQRQSNPLLASGLVNGGWVGYPTQAMAKAAIAQNPVSDPIGKGINAGGKAAGDVTGGLSAIGDFAHRLTEVQTWIRVGEVVAGLLLAYLGLSAMLKGTAAGNVITATRNKVAEGAKLAAVA